MKSVEKGLDCGVAVGMRRENLTKTQLLFQGPAHIPPSVPIQNKAVGSQEVPAVPLTPVLRGHTQEMGEEEEDSN